MPNLHPRRPRLAAFVVFLLAAITATTLLWRGDRHDRQERRDRVSNLASERARNLQRSIEYDLSATYVLVALVRQGRGAVPDFDEIAGNEKAVGLGLLQDPAQEREAFRARDTGKLSLAGPLDLVQCGMRAAGRWPVFLAASLVEPVGRTLQLSNATWTLNVAPMGAWG